LIPRFRLGSKSFHEGMRGHALFFLFLKERSW
jgi:hypothetical protein